MRAVAEERNDAGGTTGERLLYRPVVAIVGRPNVGKSTLFNRIVGTPVAVVDEHPGTTRDRIFADVDWRDKGFSLVDTGGLELRPTTPLAQKVQEQVESAIAEAEVVILLADARDGVTPLDTDIANLLRRGGKPVVVVVNKVDDERHQALVPEFYRLGLGDPRGVSAYHGRRISDLLDAVASLLPPVTAQTIPERALKVAIVGRPNVGKSMLLNSLLGEERAIVDELPGTTRDALDTFLDVNGQKMVLIDTAGIRKRGRVAPGVERYSVLRGLKAISRADVVLLVLDATEPATAQDAHVAGYIQQATKGVVILVNKWDLVPGADREEFTRLVRDSFKFLSFAPLLFISAKQKWGLEEVLPATRKVYEARLRELPPGRVNKAVMEAVEAFPPPVAGNKFPRIFAAEQVGTNPPTFVIEVNDPKLIHFSYRRYLENKLRQAGDFQGTPLRLIFKSRDKTR